jgi:predicted DNA-binding transcriptional regulator AlpA
MQFKKIRIPRNCSLTILTTWINVHQRVPGSGPDAHTGATRKETDMQPETVQPPALRLLSANEVARMCGVSRRSIWSWVSEGVFPAPVYLASRVPRWLEHQIVALVEQPPGPTPGRRRRPARRCAY